MNSLGRELAEQLLSYTNVLRNEFERELYIDQHDKRRLYVGRYCFMSTNKLLVPDWKISALQ